MCAKCEFSDYCDVSVKPIAILFACYNKNIRFSCKVSRVARENGEFRHFFQTKKVIYCTINQAAVSGFHDSSVINCEIGMRNTEIPWFCKHSLHSCSGECKKKSTGLKNLLGVLALYSYVLLLFCWVGNISWRSVIQY